MLNWQDIVTAPNTGEDILVWCPYGRQFQVVKAEGNLWRYTMDGGDRIRYSHWAPISPPAIKNVKRALT